MARLMDYAPWHCWRQGHGWLRCLLRRTPATDDGTGEVTP